MKYTRLVAGSAATLFIFGLAVTPADASTATGYRQLIGEVSQSTYLEASVPGSGSYRLEYDVTGLAFFDSYVDGTELGYVGGTDGNYLTRPVALSAGGHLVQVVGPEGSGTAQVYLVSSAAR